MIPKKPRSGRGIHIHVDKSVDGKTGTYGKTGTFKLVLQVLQGQSRPTTKERDWARSAMFRVMGQPSADGSFNQTVGLPLAPPRSDDSHNAPVTRVTLEKNGGYQPLGVAPLVRPCKGVPARQASSICQGWVPPHYHKMFCAHDRFRGLPCTQCRRTTAEGREWLRCVLVSLFPKGEL